jgi:uncharacterized protein with PIN domain
MDQSDEAKHAVCPSCKQRWLKLVKESEETIEDAHGVKWPATEYYQCERCNEKWARDVASNTWSQWHESS